MVAFRYYNLTLALPTARINELEEHNWNLSQDLEGRTAERDAALDRATELAVEVEEKSKALDTTKRVRKLFTRVALWLSLSRLLPIRHCPPPQRKGTLH